MAVPPGATLTLLTGAVLAQAVVEALKLALTYSYPWQLARLAAIAGLAALAAVALGRLSLVFVSEKWARRALMTILLVALLVAVLGPPWWDAKALWAFRAGSFAALLAVTLGALSGLRHARRAQASSRTSWPFPTAPPAALSQRRICCSSAQPTPTASSP